MKKYALVDWDGTIRRGFTLKQWMEHLEHSGLCTKSSLNKISKAFLDYEKKNISHDELAELTAMVYGRSLTGLPINAIAREAHSFILSDKKQLFSESLKLLQYIQERGISIFIVSGAPAQILSEYQKHFGFAGVFGLELTTKEGHFTGEVASNPGTSSGKRRAVSALKAAQSGMAIIAIGNSESDVPLFEEVKTCIVVDNPILSQVVKSIHITPSRNIREVINRVEKEIDFDE